MGSDFRWCRWDLTSGGSSETRGMAWKGVGEENQAKDGDMRRGEAKPPTPTPIPHPRCAGRTAELSSHKGKLGCETGVERAPGHRQRQLGPAEQPHSLPSAAEAGGRAQPAASGRCSSHFQNSWMGPDSWWQACLQLGLPWELAAAPAWRCSCLHHPLLHKQTRL